MAKTSLPALHSDDGSSRLDDVQRKRVLQAEPDTVVNLDTVSTQNQLIRGRALLTSFCH
jgi:hypothetical protein